jgi:saccharopine dehydrogenase-like NADP-dependent oxidoreductase
MKNILLLGAGRSASTLIQYLLDHAATEEWTVTVADASAELAAAKTQGHPAASAVGLSIQDEEARKALIGKADLVVSLLPPHMHMIPAMDCLEMGKHFITASYESKEMAALHAEVEAKGLIFLNEMGLDPGIDHLSAMEMVDEVRSRGGEPVAFRSYCGALVAPDSNNEWGYKFTWAPMNVVLAGQGGTATYLQDGRTRYQVYQRLFSEAETVEVPDWGKFEAYKNRDSLSYISKYGLEGIKTFYRATLRFRGYCRFWNHLLRLGLTENVTKISTEGMTKGDFLFSFLEELPGKSRLESLAAFVGETPNGDNVSKLVNLGLISDEPIDIASGTPAEILLSILEPKWKFEDDDHDLIVMLHQLDFTLKGRTKRLSYHMVVKGKDPVHTAVSRTVGLPAAIAAKLILRGEITRKGVIIPNFREIYDPVLRELEELGIGFVRGEQG